MQNWFCFRTKFWWQVLGIITSANLELVTANLKLVTANCNLFTANYKLVTANMKLVTANLKSVTAFTHLNDSLNKMFADFEGYKIK